MMEITLPKRLKTFAIFAVLLAALLMAIYLLTPTISGRTLAQVAGLDTGRQAVEAGTRAFYSVDYREAPEKWSARLCELSTSQGCTFYEQLAPAVWPEFRSQKTVVIADVQAVRTAAEEPPVQREGALMQVWEVAVTLSAPWPQSVDGATQFNAYALVFQGEQGWQFERLLLDAEAEKYIGGAQ